MTIFYNYCKVEQNRCVMALAKYISFWIDDIGQKLDNLAVGGNSKWQVFRIVKGDKLTQQGH